MGSSESGSASGQAAREDAPTTPPASPEESRARPDRRVWTIALAAGVAAGLVSWLAGEWAHGVYQPRLVEVGFGMGVTLTMPTVATQNQADFQNATLAFAICGGVTGLAMGFAGGLAGGSPSRGGMVGLGALVVGGLVGALASRALVPLFFRHYVPNTNDLLSPILIHSGIWAVISAVGGLAFAIGMRRGRRLPHAIGGACLGAILATVLFHLLGASLFLDSGSTEPIASSSVVRLLAVFLATVLIAIGAARGTLGRDSPPASPVSGH
jgi:hypothetical protein